LAAIDAANAALKFIMAAQGVTIGDVYSGGTPHAAASVPSAPSAPSTSASTNSGTSGSSGPTKTVTNT